MIPLALALATSLFTAPAAPATGAGATVAPAKVLKVKKIRLPKRSHHKAKGVCGEDQILCPGTTPACAKTLEECP